ncbi:APC family permease [Nonomuraea sp. SYSU D8015]|uniref:APC family permease n=1 Tax=Nonomuraea sp. SYSU D8015 TaxID=2593644 RepID=UPI001660DCA6|nr:APC family permease [Nonomuraea sp. SYSU D8015]
MVQQLRRTGGGGLRREVGLIPLMFFSLGSIIGSGWLFGALYAAQGAGPASVISWIVAGAGIVLLALIHAELGGAYPTAGGTARFSHFAFGGLGGYTIGWVSWIYSVALAPIEVEAALQYAANYMPWLMHTSGGTAVLSAGGYAVATVLMLVFSAINATGVRLFAETNTWTVWWKTAVPILTIIVFLLIAFKPGNFTAGGGFAPEGLKGILSVTASSGVVFALLGFESAIQMAGESRNPRRDVPLAVIGSTLIGVGVYVLLQVTFLGALDSAALRHGWAHLSFAGEFGPFAGLATALGLGWLAFVLYADAVVSPAGTGLIYTGTQARLLYAMGRDRYVPPSFGRLSDRGVPLGGIVCGFVIGMLIFLPFPSWKQLVGFVTSAAVLMYAPAPIALAALRRSDPGRPRPYRLPAAGVLAPLGFVMASLLIFWAGWTTVWHLLAAVAVGAVVLALSQALLPATVRPWLDWRWSVWMWPYFAGLAALSYLGSFDGRGVLPFGWDMAAVAVLALAIYAFALSRPLPPRIVRQYVEAAEQEAVRL